MRARPRSEIAGTGTRTRDMTLALCSALVLFVAHGLASQDPPADPAAEVDRLAPLDPSALDAALGAIADAHPELVTRRKLGASREGRELAALELVAPDLGSGSPAILLVANLDGPRLFETSVAVDHARRLADGWAAGDEATRALLGKTRLLIVPCANPDAAAARFATPLVEGTGAGRGIDDDRDGRESEDPPSDVDGDGQILSMRVPDPEGEWMADPLEPRALVKADPAKGQRGIWKLYPEGRDLDGDERVAEDGPHDARLNRNFPSGWQEHAAAAGLFPGDEPEVRALMDYVIANKSISLVLTYDALDDLVEKPKSVDDDARPVQRIPPYGVRASDAALLEELGKRYKDATASEAKGAESDAGTFQRWCYDHRGVLTLNAVLWRLPEEEKKKDTAEKTTPPEEPKDEGEEGAADAAGAESTEAPPSSEEQGKEEQAAEKEPAAEEPGAPKGKKKKDEEKPSPDAQRLAWIDGAGEAWRFRDWTAFEHPELGPVEIGGFTPYARLEPPEKERAALAAAQLAFLLQLGEVVPRVDLVDIEAEPLGADVWRVEVALQNEALLPLLTAQARRTNTQRPARVELLLPEAGRLLSGREVELVSELRGSGGRHEHVWLVQGPAGMEVAVEVATDHAGGDLERLEVQR